MTSFDSDVFQMAILAPPLQTKNQLLDRFFFWHNNISILIIHWVDLMRNLFDPREFAWFWCFPRNHLGFSANKGRPLFCSFLPIANWTISAFQNPPSRFDALSIEQGTLGSFDSDVSFQGTTLTFTNKKKLISDGLFFFFLTSAFLFSVLLYSR